jgi:hypothetical protein
MDRNQNDLARISLEQQSEDMDAKRFDSELASGYIANSEMSLEIAREFATVDRQGF